MAALSRTVLVALAVLLPAPTAVAQPIPHPPTGLAAQVAGTDVTLTWNAGPGAITYVVEAGSAHGLSDIGRFVTGGAATSFSAVGVPPGIYYVRVRGRNAAGDGAASNEVTLAVGATCALPQASAFSATVAGAAVTLSWDGTNATSYRLEVGPTPGSAASLDLDVGAATSLAATAAPGTYYARVRAQNACGLGAPSNEAAIAVDVPAAPADLRASVIGSAVTLRWTASAGPGITGYALALGSAPGAFDLGHANVGPGTSYTAGGVPDGTYAVRVRAVGAGGLGPLSNELAVTVGPPPAGTTTVTFDSLPSGGTPFVTHAEAGLVVDAIAGNWISGPALTSRRDAGTGPVDSEVRVRSGSGAAFRLVSARLYSSVTPIPYVFRGVRNGVTVYTATGTVPNTFGAYATVPNPSATVLVDEVYITVTNPATPSCGTCSNPVGIDDIVVRP